MVRLIQRLEGDEIVMVLIYKTNHFRSKTKKKYITLVVEDLIQPARNIEREKVREICKDEKF